MLIKSKVKTFAFYGIDGSGKTSLINALSRDLDFEVFHTFPQHKNDGTAVLPNTSPENNYGVFLSIVKVFYLCVKFNFFYVKNVMYGRNDLVVFDRHLSEIIITKDRYLYGGPDWLLRALVRSIPKLTAGIIVSVRPEVAIQRKGEATYDIVCEYYRNADQLKKYNKVHVVYNNETIDHVLNKIRKIVEDE